MGEYGGIAPFCLMEHGNIIEVISEGGRLGRSNGELPLQPLDRIPLGRTEIIEVQPSGPGNGDGERVLPMVVQQIVQTFGAGLSIEAQLNTSVRIVGQIFNGMALQPVFFKDQMEKIRIGGVRVASVSGGKNGMAVGNGKRFLQDHNEVGRAHACLLDGLAVFLYAGPVIGQIVDQILHFMENGVHAAGLPAAGKGELDPGIMEPADNVHIFWIDAGSSLRSQSPVDVTDDQTNHDASSSSFIFCAI